MPLDADGDGDGGDADGVGSAEKPQPVRGSSVDLRFSGQVGNVACVSGDDTVARLRDICLSMPEAVEKSFGGHTAPSFRVREKLFVMITEDEQSTWFKARPGVQEALVTSDPERFFVPPYVGPKGWVGVRLDVDQDWDELAELIEDSYRLIAPKRLSAVLDQQRDGQRQGADTTESGN